MRPFFAVAFYDADQDRLGFGGLYTSQRQALNTVTRDFGIFKTKILLCESNIFEEFSDWAHSLGIYDERIDHQFDRWVDELKAKLAEYYRDNNLDVPEP